MKISEKHISKAIILAIMFFSTLIISNKVFAVDTTQKLYQDITINKDGSMTVVEAALLDGTYNGREREIQFKNTSATTFTGVYSNFTGNTDIYNGKSIKDIEIYDISQENFDNIYDLSKKEKIYKKVNDASNGKYGVYTMKSHSYGEDFRIYCQSKKKKVFMMKYTITDAVVVHNDVAELYWNVMGENYRENISDFQVLVHLPEDDNDVRVWTHGPLTGENKIVDKKTIYFKDYDVSRYTAETIRLMFNKNMVPYATKKSNINGKENILKYEAAMAEASNAEREKNKLDRLNQLDESILKLKRNQTIYYYNRALELVNEMANEIDEDAYLAKIEDYKVAVNENWKASIKRQIERAKDGDHIFLNKYKIEELKENIEEGFDEDAKIEFYKEVELLEDLLEKKNAAIRRNCTVIVVVMFSVLTIYIIFKLIKLIAERNKYVGKYYREFPSEDEPYVLEYLMKRKNTNLSFSTTILNLILKKVIRIEKVKGTKKDTINFILANENYEGTKAEIIVMNILFNLVGENNTCNLEKLKKYGTTETKAKRLTKKIRSFKDEAKKEAESKNYFDKHTAIGECVIISILGLIALIMAIGIFYGLDGSELGLNLLKYILSVLVITSVYFFIAYADKNRTELGKEEYSKWLAHKRFLKDFSKFEDRDLPDIILWEKYLVTATVLGCADKVQKKLEMHINDFDSTTVDSYLLIATSIDRNFVKTIDSSINKSISTANSTISAASSSSGGYGGGSSFGGGGGGRRWRRRSLLNIK